MPVIVHMNSTTMEITLLGAAKWSLCEADLEAAIRLDRFLDALPLRFAEGRNSLFIHPDAWPEFFAPDAEASADP